MNSPLRCSCLLPKRTQFSTPSSALRLGPLSPVGPSGRGLQALLPSTVFARLSGRALSIPLASGTAPPQAVAAAHQPAARVRNRASHRNPRDREAQVLEASLCRACWVGQLPLPVILSLRRPAALLVNEGDPRATRLRRHDQVPATPVRLQTAQPDPPNEPASLGGALLRIGNALEQKHGSAGTVHDAFGLNPKVAKIRYHLRGSVLSRGFWSLQAWRPGADSEGGENPHGPEVSWGLTKAACAGI